MPLPGGGYGACQISFTDGRSTSAYALDWHSPHPPTLDDLRAAGPLILTHHAHEDVSAHINIQDPPPPSFVWLGTLPGMTEQAPSLSGWAFLPLQVALQRRWDLRLPAGAKSAYKAATPEPRVVDFGAGPTSLPASKAFLYTQEDITIPPDGPVLWDALDSLPRLTAISWTGPDRGLSAALASRPMISDLYWQDPPATVDLSATELTNLDLTGAGRVTLPPGLIALTLKDTTGRFEVADGGRWIRLTLDKSPVPAGLISVRDLHMTVPDSISAAELRVLEDLESLSIRFTGPPGSLLDAEELAAFRHLHTLSLRDAYGLEAASLPSPWPTLRHLKVQGVRTAQTKPLKARYREIRLTVSGAKSDRWLAANLHNPFRDWADDDKQAADIACRAYAAAIKAIESAEARDVLQAMVEKLNTLEDFIDTIRREEIAEAFFDLAERAGVTSGTAEDWFDDWRDF